MQIDIKNKEYPLPEAVLLDMDGLLLDTEKVARHAFFHSCEMINFTCPEEEYPQLIGHSSILRDKLLASILPNDADINSFNQHWWDCFHQTLSGEVPAKIGAMDFLNYIYSKNIKIVVVTSSDTQSADTLLTRAKLRPFVGLIIGGDQVKKAKPAPDIYLKAVSYANVPASKCIAFEDSDVGTLAAHAAGIRVIQIPDVKAPSEECASLGHLIFDSLDKVRNEFGWR